VIDTSVLLAGVAGFKETYVRGKNSSADILYSWAQKSNFVWLVSEEILEEYKEILRRFHVRPSLIGRIINLIRKRAEFVEARYTVEISPDPKDDAFCVCAGHGRADVIVTLNIADFPQERLKAKVTSPDGFSR
jgi:uncharacterized protein